MGIECLAATRGATPSILHIFQERPKKASHVYDESTESSDRKGGNAMAGIDIIGLPPPWPSDSKARTAFQLSRCLRLFSSHRSILMIGVRTMLSFHALPSLRRTRSPLSCCCIALTTRLSRRVVISLCSRVFVIVPRQRSSCEMPKALVLLDVYLMSAQPLTRHRVEFQPAALAAKRRLRALQLLRDSRDISCVCCFVKRLIPFCFARLDRPSLVISLPS